MFLPSITIIKHNRMSIWKTPISAELFTQFNGKTLGDSLGMEFVESGDDYLTMRMPVDHRTVQPMRLLHGGASVALAETLGSMAGLFCVDDPNTQAVVGVEINANHLRSVREGSGFVYGTVRPVRVGKTIQVWNIEIKDERDHLVCVSRLTCAVVKRRNNE